MTNLCLDRAVIKVTGDDRFSFLQGLLTKDVYKAQSALLYSLMLTPKGRFFTDLFLFDHENSLYVDVAKEHIAVFLSKLKLYKLRAKVSFELLEGLYVYAMREPVKNSLCFKDPRTQEDLELGYRFYSYDECFQAISQNDYHKMLLRFAIPDGPKDMEVERSIPLEWSLDKLGAIDWDKGCYMGQEFTARTKYQGIVRKGVFCLKGEQLQKDLLLFKNDSEIGRVISVFEDLGLALLNLEHVDPAGDTLNLETGKKIISLPKY